MQRWVEIELASADLGDARREQRLRTLVSQLSRNPQGTFNQACRGAAGKQAAPIASLTTTKLSRGR